MNKYYKYTKSILVLGIAALILFPGTSFSYKQAIRRSDSGSVIWSKFVYSSEAPD